jgi:cytoskeleton protein RodZ
MIELTGVGQELAAAREARGLAVSDVAQQLKFMPRQLEALEQEQFEALPGATFTRGMVRSYARLLQLDPDPLVQRISRRIEIPDSNQLAARYNQPVPFTDHARRSTFVYLAMSLGVLVLVGGVAYEWHQERTAAAKKGSAVAKARPVPERNAVPPEPRNAVPAPEPRNAAPAPTRAPVVAAAAPAQPAVAAQSITPKIIAPEKPQEKTKVQEKPAQERTFVTTAPASSLPPGRYRLVVRTVGEAWIEIKDSADRMLVSSLNPAGSERVVRGTPPYSVVIGNASQVIITYDDKPVNLAPHIRQDVARLTIP